MDSFEVVCEIEPPTRPDLTLKADAWYVQVSYDLHAMSAWRATVLGPSNTFDGAHLVPVTRYRQVAAALAAALP